METARRPGIDDELSELREVVLKHHVHFEVQPEIVILGPERRKVGYEIRLWAVHPKGARVLPGCGKCRALTDALRQILAAVLPIDDRSTWHVIEPPAPRVYDSAAVEGADEVAVSVRLLHRQDYDFPAGACQERCLREIRCALKLLGAREG